MICGGSALGTKLAVALRTQSMQRTRLPKILPLRMTTWRSSCTLGFACCIWNDLQLFDLKEKETTEAAVAFYADFDIARAVIFDAGGEFSWQILAESLQLYADFTALFKLRADRFKIFAVHISSSSSS